MNGFLVQGPRTNLDGLVEAGSLMGVRLAIIILQILVNKASHVPNFLLCSMKK